MVPHFLNGCARPKTGTVNGLSFITNMLQHQYQCNTAEIYLESEKANLYETLVISFTILI